MKIFKKLMIVAAFAVLFITHVNAQVSAWVVMKQAAESKLPSIRVGEQVPNVSIDKIINYSQYTANIDDFKDKLLILDFWSTMCPGCILGLPKLDALQNEFGTKVLILPVTYEQESLVKEFWKNNLHTKNLKLPSVVEDRLLMSYFKFKELGLKVWIYKGKVVALTDPEYVDKVNIQKVLNGEKINFPVRDDFAPKFDGFKQALFKQDTNQVNPDAVLKYATISDYRADANTGFLQGPSGVVKDSANHTIRTFFINWPIFLAYTMELGKGIKMGSLVKPSMFFFPQYPNETVWEVADRNKYRWESTAISGYHQTWMQKHAICFESLKKDEKQSDAQISTATVSDLNLLLGLNVRWEKRKEKVLILVKAGDLDRFKSKKPYTIEDHNRGLEPYMEKGSLRQFRDVRVWSIADKMNQQDGNPYVFDETNYEEKIDMDLIIPSWKDIPAIRKVIAPYGLELKEEERLVDKFVFTEVNRGLPVDGKKIEAAEAKAAAKKADDH